jgi:hypothetical protein
MGNLMRRYETGSEFKLLSPVDYQNTDKSPAVCSSVDVKPNNQPPYLSFNGGGGSSSIIWGWRSKYCRIVVLRSPKYVWSRKFSNASLPRFFAANTLYTKIRLEHTLFDEKDTDNIYQLISLYFHITLYPKPVQNVVTCSCFWLH